MRIIAIKYLKIVLAYCWAYLNYNFSGLIAFCFHEIQFYLLDYKKEAEKSDQVSDGDDEEVGGIFKVMSEKKRQVLLEKDVFNAEDCSKFTVPCLKDWNSDEVCVFGFFLYFMILCVGLKVSSCRYAIVFGITL